MSKKNNDIAINRVILFLFSIAGLSLLTWLYIMPFKKHYLQINNYYQIIEYIVIAVVFLAAVASVVYSKILKKRGVDISSRIFTPNMLNILSISAFAGSVIIPLSKNRVVISKLVIVFYIFIFIAYICYYFVKKAFAYQTIVCGIYVTLLLLLNTYYADSITFNDAIAMKYSTALLLFACFISIVVLATWFVNKKNSAVVLWQTGLLSVLTAAALLVRLFVLEYVILVAIAVLLLTLTFFVVYEKLINKK